MIRNQSTSRRWVSFGLLKMTLLVLSYSIASVFSHCAFAADEMPPNVVVILVDDLGYGDLTCYGGEDLQTVHINQLAREGIRLTRFYATSSVCSPTRASLLSGCYPELVGVPGVIRTHPENSWGELSSQAELLPAALSRKGYGTAMIGKWHLGLAPEKHPMNFGFEHFQGFLGDMMDDYYTHLRHGFNYMRNGRDKIEPEGHATELFSDWACDYLKSRKDESQPFFLYLAYNAPHTPIQPPNDWFEKVQSREPQMSERRAKLVALIEHLDEGVGKVMECLEEEGLAEDTIVILTSDNGGQLGVGASNGSLRDGKQSMYEGGLRVPCIVRWPGQIEAGRVSDEISCMTDIFPTLCSITGADLPQNQNGKSLHDVLLDDQATLGERVIYFHRREGGTRYGGMIIHAVQAWPWKLLKNSPYEPYELYQLDKDPLESRDVITEQQAKYQELSALLRRQLQRSGSIPWQPSPLRESPIE